jgi:hypothetical protein
MHCFGAVAQWPSIELPDLVPHAVAQVCYFWPRKWRQFLSPCGATPARQRRRDRSGSSRLMPYINMIIYSSGSGWPGSVAQTSSGQRQIWSTARRNSYSNQNIQFVLQQYNFAEVEGAPVDLGRCFYRRSRDLIIYTY